MSDTKNASLNNAKKAKNDEFYTNLSDIEKEVVNYKEHFKNKVVLCNCNDALHGNFAKYFSLNFEKLGLKKLMCSSYGENAMLYEYYGDKNDNNVPDIEEWASRKLNGDGSFSSEEMINVLKESDIVVTNPPFSLFRQFVTLLLTLNKKFLIIGNMNGITYSEVFPSIKSNKMWLGTQYVKQFITDNGEVKKFGNILWYTNLTHNKRNTPLDLYKHYSEDEYPHYDNYNAINVNKTCDIPMDFNGIMGVPITFLEKYCPTQFEIVDRINCPSLHGEKIYKRLLIKKK